MSDTMQSLDQLASLKTVAPEAPKYVKKVANTAAPTPPASARTRSPASGSSGRRQDRGQHRESKSIRPSGAAHADPAAAGRSRAGRPVRRHLHGRAAVCRARAGAVRHGISKALTNFEPDLRGVLKKGGFLTATPAPWSARSTAGRRRAVVPVLEALIASLKFAAIAAFTKPKKGARIGRPFAYYLVMSYHGFS